MCLRVFTSAECHLICVCDHFIVCVCVLTKEFPLLKTVIFQFVTNRHFKKPCGTSVPQLLLFFLLSCFFWKFCEGMKKRHCEGHLGVSSSSKQLQFAKRTTAGLSKALISFYICLSQFVTNECDFV